jgi:amino acid transporter
MSFIPVLFIAISYFHLNRKDPDCGASYSWLSKLMSPYVGWFNGWVQVATSAIFCVSAPILAGSYTLQFLNAIGAIDKTTQSSIWWTAIAGALWLGLITFICIYGIRWTTNFQWVLVMIEYIVVIGFSVGGIIKVAATHPAGSTGFHFGWLNPVTVFHQGGMSAVAGGVALGAFFFWGWDTAVNLNEESKNPSVTPGRGAIISMWLLLAVFMLNLVAVQMLLTPKEISDQGANVLFYFGNQLFGSWAGYVMIFAVLSSTVATTQTTLLPAARIAYSMSRDRVFPRVFGTIHPKFLTPALGTVVLAFFSLFGILLSTGVSSVNTLLGKLVGDIGILVAFYYGITGIACAWGYRKVAFQQVKFFFSGVLLPFLSGCFLIYIGIYIMKSDPGYALPDLVILGLGIPLVIVAKLVSKGEFFNTKTIAYDSIE